MFTLTDTAFNSFIILGILGTCGMLGWGFYRFKYRGGMSPSVFLMHLRVKAQGMIVGAITLGKDSLCHACTHAQFLTH